LHGFGWRCGATGGIAIFGYQRLEVVQDRFVRIVAHSRVVSVAHCRGRSLSVGGFAFSAPTLAA
jgi:hypothetical protein